MSYWPNKPPPGVPINTSHRCAQGLACYLPFNDGAGNIVRDISGNGNHGTLTNMTLTGAWGPGKFGNSLNLDGVDDFINLGNPASLNFGTGNFTISIWFRTGSTGTMYLFGSYGTGDIFGYVTGGNAIRWVARDSAGNDIDCNATSGINVVNRWCCTTFIRRGAVGESYLDGVLVATNTDATVGSTDSGGNKYIGSLTSATGYFAGKIDHVKIHNRALSAEEVKKLHSEPFCIMETPRARRFYILAGGGTIYYANLTDNMSISDIVGKSAQIKVADTLSISDILNRLAQIGVTDKLGIGDNVKKDIETKIADKLSLSDNLSTTLLYLVSLADKLGIMDMLNKFVGINPADKLSMDDAQTLSIVRGLDDKLGITDSIKKHIESHISDKLSLSDAISTSFVFFITLADKLGITDDLKKDVEISLSDIITISETFIKTIGSHIVDRLTITDDITVILISVEAAGYMIEFRIKKPGIGLDIDQPLIEVSIKKPRIDIDLN